VQQAIEEAKSEADQLALALGLKGNVHPAMQCPHANHVLQKVVNTLSPQSLQFMIDEIVELGPEVIRTLAQHRYSCRILEALLLRCTHQQLSLILASLIADAVNLCVHRNANFAMRRVVEHDEWSVVLIGLLRANLIMVCGSFFGSLVIVHALQKGPSTGQVHLAEAIANEPKALQKIRSFKHGAAIVDLVARSAGKAQT